MAHEVRKAGDHWFEEYKPERHQTREYYVGLNANMTSGILICCQKARAGFRNQAYLQETRRTLLHRNCDQPETTC